MCWKQRYHFRNLLSRSMRYIWRVAVAISLIASPPKSWAREGQMARVDAAMINFTQALQGIEKGLQEKRVEATLVHARWLRVAAEDAALKIEPQTNGELSYLFYEYLEKTREGSTAIIDLANAGDWLGVGQEVEGIRHNCISCHVRFANDTYGFYPAQQNLLVGEIEILKLSG